MKSSKKLFYMSILSIFVVSNFAWANTLVHNNIYFASGNPVGGGNQKNLMMIKQAIQKTSLPKADSFQLGRLDLNVAVVDSEQTKYHFHTFLNENSTEGQACWLKVNFSINHKTQIATDVDADYSCANTLED